MKYGGHFTIILTVLEFEADNEAAAREKILEKVKNLLGPDLDGSSDGIAINWEYATQDWREEPVQHHLSGEDDKDIQLFGDY